MKYSDTKSRGTKTIEKKSINCVAAPAQFYVDCEGDFGKGWKFSHEIGCDLPNRGIFSIKRGVCTKSAPDYWPGNRGQCCVEFADNDRAMKCPPEWRDPAGGECREFSRGIAGNYLRSQQPFTRNLRLWRAGNEAAFSQEAAANCREISRFRLGSECEAWCTDPTKTNYRRCSPDALDEYCARPENVTGIFCQDKVKPYLISNAGHNVPLMRKSEIDICSVGHRLGSPRCRQISQRENLPATFQAAHDKMWEKYCVSPTAAPAESGQSVPADWRAPPDFSSRFADYCGCLAGDAPADSAFARRDCFDTKCASNSLAYRPMYMKNASQCPNVCAAIIRAEAGKSAVIRNVSIYQNCFGAATKETKDEIVRGIRQEISREMTALGRLMNLLGQTPPTAVHSAVKSAGYDLERERKNAAAPLMSGKGESLKIKAAEALAAYRAITGIRWDKYKGVPDGEAKIAGEYQGLRADFAGIMAGVPEMIDDFLEKAATMDTPVPDSAPVQSKADTDRVVLEARLANISRKIRTLAAGNLSAESRKKLDNATKLLKSDPLSPAIEIILADVGEAPMGLKNAEDYRRVAAAKYTAIQRKIEELAAISARPNRDIRGDLEDFAGIYAQIGAAPLDNLPTLMQQFDRLFAGIFAALTPESQQLSGKWPAVSPMIIGLGAGGILAIALILLLFSRSGKK